jgi:hypothetical protein
LRIGVGIGDVRSSSQDPDQAKIDRVMAAIMTMVKIDIAKLESAYNGG